MTSNIKLQVFIGQVRRNNLSRKTLLLILELQCHLSINGPLVADNLRKLFDEVKVISSLGILRYVRSTDVVQLLHIIRDLVKSSGTFQIVAAEHSGNPKINEIMSVLDAISLAMHFLTSSCMSREIYRRILSRN